MSTEIVYPDGVEPGDGKPHSQPFEIAGTAVPPGSRIDLFLSVSESFLGDRLSIPVTVVHGMRRGPTLFVTAAIHGDELNGIGIVRELLGGIEPTDLSGALICVPVVNVLGLPLHSRYLPDRRDLNRHFPGSTDGSMASRLANLIISEVVSSADVGVDLHTAAYGRANWPQIRAQLDDERTLELARAFGPPLIVDAPLRSGSLREAGSSLGVPVLTFEGGQALRFEDDVIAVGVDGLRRLMLHLGMMPGPAPELDGSPLESDETHWVRADRGGMMSLEVSLGQKVTEGDPLWTVSSPFGRERAQHLSPWTGVVIGMSTIPLVNPGDAVVHIAVPGRSGQRAFDDPEDVEGDDRHG